MVSPPKIFLVSLMGDLLLNALTSVLTVHFIDVVFFFARCYAANFYEVFFLIFRPIVDSAGIIKYILFVHYIFPSLAFVRNINFVAVSFFKYTAI